MRPSTEETAAGAVRNLLVLAAFLGAFLGIAAPALAEIRNIGNAEVARRLASGVPLVDIRTSGEWRRTGVIEDSQLVTFVDAQGHFDPPTWLAAIRQIAAADEPIMVICHSGGRSTAATRILSEQFGYLHIYNVHRGIAHWIEDGRPTVPGP